MQRLDILLTHPRTADSWTAEALAAAAVAASLRVKPASMEVAGKLWFRAAEKDAAAAHAAVWSSLEELTAGPYAAYGLLAAGDHSSFHQHVAGG